MRTVVIVFDVLPADVEAMTAIATATARHTLEREGGCVRFEVHRDLYNLRYSLIQQFIGEDAYRAHTATPYAAEFNRRAAELIIPSSRTIIEAETEDPI